MTQQSEPDSDPAVEEEGGELEQPAFDQFLAVESYREAIKQSLTSADGALDSVLTASFGIATAYGALITLVRPKDAQPVGLLALPFLFFAVAISLSLTARLLAVNPVPLPVVDVVDQAVARVVKRKRRLASCAVAGLVVALVTAGIVASAAYGRDRLTPKKGPVCCCPSDRAGAAPCLPGPTR